MSDIDPTPSNDSPQTAPVSPLAEAWGADLAPLICEQCDWILLAPSGAGQVTCPNCHQAVLSPLKDAGDEANHSSRAGHPLQSLSNRLG